MYLARTAGVLLGAVILFVGLLGLAVAYFGSAPLGETADGVIDAIALHFEAFGLTGRRLEDALIHPSLRFTLAPLGIALAIFSLRWRREGTVDAAPDGGVVPQDKRMVRKTVKHAGALRKKGQHLEAAEVLLSAEQLDASADAFVEAGELVRAAEIRHDQNRFVESAELYVQAGDFTSAAMIFASQEEFGRAADCYLKADSKSTAAEMFEKAGDFRQAAECYRDCEFLRHAAHCFVKCEEWLEAARCLESVYREESVRTGAMGDERKHAELMKLVRQAGKLFTRAGELDKALAILERGSCHSEAAVIAERLGDNARAAALHLEAGDSVKAAEALRAQGEDQEAARILGEFHRDRGDSAQAAEFFLEAGEFLAAGDLFRQSQDSAKAAECYEKQGDFLQAAEMFRVAGDRARAADAYERANHFTEAAECYALSGQGTREAALLEKAGDFLGSGEAYHREGKDDEAIKVLQQVEAGTEGFGRAAALLGDLFQARGQLPLAIAKLKQAVGEHEVGRENLPSYYTLATILEANGNHSDAADIYERILALDYHHRDVSERLLRLRTSEGAASAIEDDASRSATASPPASQPGRYQILGELGRGGMGIVYKAKDTALDRLVAFKVLPDTLKANPQALKNFLREAKAAAKLNHPNIVTVYDTGEQDGRYYIAMEYVDGTTIKEILRRRGPISAGGVMHVLMQMCEALAYAHEQKVVHRDIKSANTMWTRDRKAKLMDFGLAKVVEEVRNNTTVVSGTPYYMSPEQTLGKNVDHRTDIYSLGVTLFEMVAGTVPFKDGNIPYHHVHTPPPNVREHCSEVPEVLASIIDRCLEKDPAHRFQTTQEILDELRRSLQADRDR